MGRKYYTFCVWDNGAWYDEFGDYSKAAVMTEMREHDSARRHKVIITHDDSAAAMMTARNALPAPKG